MSAQAATLEQDAAIFDSPDDRLLIQREAAADPRLAAILRVMFRDPDGERKVAEFAKAAAINELDPKSYPETRGYWKILRSTTKKIVDELPKLVIKAISLMSPEEQAEALANAKSGRPVHGVPFGLGDLGQWDIIGSIVGSVVNAAAGAYGAYATTSAQRDIAKRQQEAQQAQLAAAMSMASAQQAMANATQSQAAQIASSLPSAIQAPAQAAISALTADVGGVPAWMLLLGVYLFFKYK